MTSTTGILNTKIGNVAFTMTQADHVYLRTESGESVIVRGIPYHVSYHCYLIDGQWKAKDYHDPYVSRRDILKDASHAARKTIAEVLAAAWVDYLGKNPQASNQADLNHALEVKDRLAEEVAELEAKLRVKQGELRAAYQDVDRLKAAI